MSFSKKIKSANKKVSSSFIGTDRYWQKSPSNILLKKAAEQSLKKYARNKKILDAGAGRLAYKKLILQYTKKYTSSDFQKTHPELDVVSDIENLSFEDNTFDVVFCSQVLEHVPHPQKAFSEINRVLKPGGHAIITVPMLGYIHNAPYDFYRYTRYGLETLSKDAGFEIITIKPVGGLFSFLGYIRSTMIMPLYAAPLIGTLIFWVNFIFSCLEILLDKITKNSKIFPLNYLLIIQKPTK